MKVGDQAVDHLEAVAGGDEDIGFGRAGFYRAIGVAGRFQRAQAGRADGDHPATGSASRGDGFSGGLRNLVTLAVHAVLGNFVDAHRLVSAGADMQGQEGGIDALLA
jgi:hypothetical protein